MLTFNTKQAAKRFAAGYIVDRIVIKQGKQFRIVSPSTAKRLGAKVI